MRRDHLNFLRQWRNDPIRVPLMIRGARQVGKSWLVTAFGEEFEHFISINFEKDKRVHALFPDHIDIHKTLETLRAYTKIPTISGKTLLFLDEIQECPNAIRYLRYFKEELPELHVIAAGSLLEFTLEKLGVAVGRIDYLFLYPLSFMEFLTALNRDDLREAITNKNIDAASHEVLLEHLKNYMWLGGMPAVVSTWIQHRDFILCQRIQDRIIGNYEDDFQKYAKKHQIETLGKVFRSIGKQLGKKFQYINVDNDMKTYPIKQGLHLLIRAGVAHLCYHTSGHVYPLEAESNEKKFKVYLFDIGISHRLLGLDLAEWVTSPLHIDYLGESAEQLVAQELIAYGNPSKRGEIYYWHVESKSGNAEVDFIDVKENKIVPIEVKSGVKGGMKSLNVFFETHPKATYGVKISEMPFSRHGNLEEIPLYAVASWKKNQSSGY
ncbi:MAG: ATP-binding protein [Verrucomicrobia bacterium]|nr:ATP-binding protein [Verrucomicrobiota bacterium]